MPNIKLKLLASFGIGSNSADSLFGRNPADLKNEKKLSARINICKGPIFIVLPTPILLIVI